MQAVLKLTLAEVARRLDRAGVAWGIFAGAAGAVYGVRRAIQDVDILLPQVVACQVTALFPQAILEYQAPEVPGALGWNGVEMIFGLRQNIHLDLDAAMIARLQRHPLLGVSASLVSREDNLAIKALFGRGAEQGKHDWADIAEMLAAAPALDWDYLYWRLTQTLPARAPDLYQRLRAMADVHKTSDQASASKN